MKRSLPHVQYVEDIDVSKNTPPLVTSWYAALQVQDRRSSWQIGGVDSDGSCQTTPNASPKHAFKQSITHRSSEQAPQTEESYTDSAARLFDDSAWLADNSVFGAPSGDVEPFFPNSLPTPNASSDSLHTATAAPMPVPKRANKKSLS